MGFHVSKHLGEFKDKLAQMEKMNLWNQLPDFILRNWTEHKDDPDFSRVIIGELYQLILYYEEQLLNSADYSFYESIMLAIKDVFDSSFSKFHDDFKFQWYIGFIISEQPHVFVPCKLHTPVLFETPNKYIQRSFQLRPQSILAKTQIEAEEYFWAYHVTNEMKVLIANELREFDLRNNLADTELLLYFSNAQGMDDLPQLINVR